MDDLSLLTHLNPELLPDAATLAPARQRLLAAARAESAAPHRAVSHSTAPHTTGPQRTAAHSTAAGAPAAGRHPLAAVSSSRQWVGTPRRRFAVLAAVTTAVAAGLAAVMVVGPTATIAGRQPVAVADAKEVLAQAAQAAVRQPDLHPRPDQFVYLRTSAEQKWISVDGRSDGLVRSAQSRILLPYCRDGRQLARDKEDRVIPGRTQECAPIVGFHPDMPTTAAAMQRWLEQNAGGAPGDTNALGKGILFLLEGSYLRPRSLAALYQVAARIRGMQVLPDVADAAGRHGVGVGWGKDGSRMVLIFDRDTHAYLGSAYTPPGGGPGGTSALLRIAVVNAVGRT